MIAAPSLWGFGPEDAPVTVRNAEALLAHLPVFIGGWPLRRLGDGRDAKPDIDVVEVAGGGFTIRISGPGGNDAACSDEFEAANALAGGLITGFVVQQPNRICLHAGAVALGDGLAVMLGNSLASKSGVALQMTAAGHRLFGDDRLGVEAAGDDGGGAQGLCLGLMPRLRLPLPADCGARFAEFVDGYTEIRNDDLVYLKLWEGETAGFGDTAPITTLIFLDRCENGPVRLEPEDRDTMTNALLENCFAPHIKAARLAAWLGAIVEGCACYRATFSSSREVAIAIAAI
ncbi:MAG: hypothetical protein V3R85_11820 [Alphaproteobacteria bacterium]